MIFPAFNYKIVFSNQNDCADGQYFYHNTFKENGMEFVRLFTSFPLIGSNLEEDYKMWYVFALDSGAFFRVTGKITVFRQHHRLSELISIMSTLLSDKCEPTYSVTDNDLVSERRITVGPVCVFRDYVWNVANRLSFTSKDNYEWLEKEATNAINQTTIDFSLFYDLTAIQRGHHVTAMTVPDSKNIPEGMLSVVDVTKWNELSSISPFWPKVREDLIDKLSDQGWIDFYPMDELRVLNFSKNNTGDRNFRHVIATAKKECCECYQDYCVWSVNGVKILKNIELVNGGVWREFHPNKKRREFGYIQASFAIKHHGRDIGLKKKPTCVVQSLNNMFPDE